MRACTCHEWLGYVQVPWYAVLGNHDYGEMWNVSAMPVPSNCKGSGFANCYYGPLHQVRRAEQGKACLLPD